jgi:hypothetical protein
MIPTLCNEQINNTQKAAINVAPAYDTSTAFPYPYKYDEKMIKTKQEAHRKNL